MVVTTPDRAGVSGSPAFRLAYVPGVTPGKWVRIWEERRPDAPLELVALEVAECADAIGQGSVQMAITRLPDALRHGEAGPHHTIELYEETTVVVVPKDHVLTAGDELTLADLADEQFLWPLDEPVSGFVDPAGRVAPTERSEDAGGSAGRVAPTERSEDAGGSAGRVAPTERSEDAAYRGRPGTAIDHRPETTGDAIELVAAGIGVLLVPQSLARLHHRKDLVYRPVSDAPTGTVGLLWPDPTTELADEFIGIVRGRKATSSRGQSEPAPKRSAREKAAAKRAARESAGKIPGKSARKKPGVRPKRR
ncbi:MULTISPECIES: LysR substrate-binding domain-containing protein [Gordonia]|uniref:LysR substrate-binding domain-containing protein n=1 Tax=Gordonia amicalis TaxID=89053 RepID=A0AAE4U6K7_9ACTN|nr:MULTISPECIES: LysR substrate-binding domain-containing protein [Gordonia]ATD72432.1 LysR family transcriptional regulator [Gordonia sp. 1D]MCZ4579069.1 LysR substrate-binding domain-containing protein [Gordonia amicalis]MCZ4652612.1 LysR substrate-binding domain-containing protein [Gordonia amicalis]MDJ0454680.1 LysR substrate-binding domain-containing protein [Gordonia amicalis]MDV6309371.1 LysR substrate-binding domain-containing protein [Gordonia amicalis]